MSGRVILIRPLSGREQQLVLFLSRGPLFLGELLLPPIIIRCPPCIRPSMLFNSTTVHSPLQMDKLFCILDSECSVGVVAELCI